MEDLFQKETEPIVQTDKPVTSEMKKPPSKDLKTKEDWVPHKRLLKIAPQRKEEEGEDDFCKKKNNVRLNKQTSYSYDFPVSKKVQPLKKAINTYRKKIDTASILTN